MNKQEIYAMLARLEEAARQLDDDAIEGEYEETNLLTGVITYHTPAAEQDTAPEPELDQESKEQPEQESDDQDDAQEGQFTEIPDYQYTSIPVYQDTNKSGTRKLLFIFLTNRPHCKHRSRKHKLLSLFQCKHPRHCYNLPRQSNLDPQRNFYQC